MEQNSRYILFIDDHSKHYLSALKIAAETSGFELIASDNVLDGLQLLEEYASIIDAVILDLCFPEVEMQGPEALQKIKKKYAYLPVIILTDSDSAADLEVVVDCMKKGAYNYVGKKTLNPVYLFQLVDQAVKQNRLLRYTNASIQPKVANSTFPVLLQDADFGRFRKKAIFGFELSSVSKPANENDEQAMKKNALDWHENLLKSISTPFRDSIQINLKYISEKDLLKIRIIFSLVAEDDETLQQRIRYTQQDVKAFFSNQNENKNTPYLFEKISDEKILKDSLEFTGNYSYNLFFRSPLKVRTNGTIGFNTTKSGEQTNYSGFPIYRPDELFPLPLGLSSNNELFRALNAQQHYTEIDVQLMPKALIMEEIDILKQVAKNTSLIQNLHYNIRELELFTDYLNKFILSANEKFIVSVLLKSDGGQEQQHLKSAMQNYFFGQCHVQTDIRSADKLLRFRTNANDNPNWLPFFYSIKDVLQVFRLPLPDRKSTEGISSLPVAFTQLPKNLSEQGILIGEKSTINGTLPIRISEESMARHLYIMGQTGTGKSTLLKNMIADCLKKNYGFALIDPHGDLFDDIQKLIPKAKRNKLIVVNTTDPENSAKHNPIGYDEHNPHSKSLVINELIRILGSLYDMRHVGGPMFELYAKNGLLLVMDDQVQEKISHATLQDFVKLFFDDYFRKDLISLCGNKNVVDFFNVAEQNSGDWSFDNFATYITSKLTRFTEDYYLTPIISAKQGNINFRKLIDDGNILLVKMDKGLIGPDNVSLLGQMLVSSMVLAAMSRANMKKHERKPFYLFIDEFQNFIKGDIGSALSEVRKYGLSLTLANQTLSQLNEKHADVDLVESLMGNVGSMIFFRPGVNDYEKIRHYIEPEFKREDVLKLPNFHCIGRLLTDNIPSDPFVFQNKYE